MRIIERGGEKFGRFASHEELVNAVTVLTDDKIGAAFRDTPRELFIDGRQKNFALDDRAVFIPGHRGESSVSQTSTVALMTKLLNPQPDDVILEIGLASGYQSAILSKLARHVVSVDVLPDLVHKAKKRHEALGITNVDVLIADGSSQLAKTGSFDKIIVTASMPPDPQHDLFNLLNEGGRLVAPIGGIQGDPTRCDLIVFEKRNGHIVELLRVPGYSFVSMEGRRGWTHFTKFVIHSFNKMLGPMLQRAEEISRTK